MFALFYRLILRPLRREPVRTLLTAAAVALGVAAVIAIELAGQAAVGSFQSSMETLASSVDYEVRAVGGVPPEALASLAQLPYPLAIHARIEDYVLIEGNRRTVPLLGVDFLAEPPAIQTTSNTTDFSGFSENDVWLSQGLGYKTGDTLTLLFNDRSAQVHVRGTFNASAGSAIVMDLAPATRLLRPDGTLTRILIQAPNSRENWQQILQSALPAGVTVSPEGTRTEENRRMLDAFRWNLRILSYIALTVGAFLIYNTISVSVVRRRAEIGVVRALGASRWMILSAFLGEAAAFGIFGGLAGLLAGRALAEGAVKMIGATVDALYVSSRPAPIQINLTIVALALIIGLAMALLSAFSPAWEASLVSPIEAMARGRREHAIRLHRLRNLILAALFAVASWIASRQPAVGGKPLWGYLAAAMLIAASSLAIPALISLVAATTGPLLLRVFGAEALLATRALTGSLRRTSVLVGALATSVAMLAAIAIMVGSFRETVDVWLSDRLQADLYLRPAIPGNTDQHPLLDPALVPKLRAIPGVAAVDQFRAYEISYQGIPATLGAGEVMILARYARQALMSGQRPSDVYPGLVNQDAVLVSEPFAEKHHVRAGDTLTLPLSGRNVRFRILDVQYDYSSERGLIIMDRSTLLKYLPDPAPSNIAVYFQPNVDLNAGRQAVDAALAGHRVASASNRSLRQEALRVFDRTFAITYALEALAVFVAVMGVGGALVALVIDRRREFALLRFLGAAQSQVRRIVLFEAGLLGLFANLAGMLLGYFLSLLLIYVINKQSFGWTIQFHWPVTVLLGALSVVYVATVLAGLYPGRIATQLIPRDVIHEE